MMSSDREHFLGIDVGTSGVKAILVRRRGDVAARAMVAHPLSTPRPGWAEQDPDDWWKAAVAAIKQVIRKARVPARKIVSVGLSGQMHSSVFLDRQSKVIRPALLWCDGRTTLQCREITARIGEENLRRWACNPALEGFTLPKVLWLRQHEPSAFARLAKVVLPKDYIRYRLTSALVSEPSDASGTLMYDTAGLRWSEEILDALALEKHLVPEVGGSAEILSWLTPEAAKATGLLPGTPVAGGGADNACGALGVGAISPGEAVASWGTSGTVLAPTAEPTVDPQLRAHTFCHVVPRTWYAMGVMLTAGGAFAWYRGVAALDLARKPDADRRLDDEAAEVPIGSLGLTFLPYLQGERTPHRDAAARGAFVGLSLAHTRAHMTRAVLEGIVFGMRDSVSVLQELGLPLSQILLTGGGAASPFLRQLQADAYGLPVRKVNREEGPAYGAALLGAVGVGAFPTIEAACKATLKRERPLRPNRRAHAALEEPYQRFKRLYPLLRGNF
jgi:xylulokinase